MPRRPNLGPEGDAAALEMAALAGSAVRCPEADCQHLFRLFMTGCLGHGLVSTQRGFAHLALHVAHRDLLR